ncbi:MAG: DUF4923 family protein [Prevotellaceae bacterium]|nr:DUF4923 family protein [Prevotellaceae bacterium]
MHNIKTIATLLLIGTLSLTGCDTPGTLGSSRPNGLTGTTTSATTSSSAGNVGTLISSIIGQFASSTTESTIIGTWVYQEPAVQFESENLLTQAGGSVAAANIIKKIEPYYKMAGITAGKFAFTFNKDNTCTYLLNGKTYNGTYTFDNSNKTLTISTSMMTLPAAYVSVSLNNLTLTFDSTKLLSIAQTLAGASGNATLSTLSSLTGSVNGMKTGFLFKKQ